MAMRDRGGPPYNLPGRLPSRTLTASRSLIHGSSKLFPIETNTTKVAQESTENIRNKSILEMLFLSNYNLSKCPSPEKRGNKNFCLQMSIEIFD